MSFDQKISDRALIAAIRRSDTQAFKILYYRYFEKLYRFVYQKVYHADTAKDLVQDLFFNLWKNRDKLDESKSIKAYLFKSANNLAIDHLRRKVTADTYAQKQTTAPHTEISGNFELKDELERRLNTLPADQKTILLLNRLEGFKYAEIADMLGISIKTVEKKMSLALKTLREALKHLLLYYIVFKTVGLGIGFFLFYT